MATGAGLLRSSLVRRMPWVISTEIVEVRVVGVLLLLLLLLRGGSCAAFGHVGSGFALENVDSGEQVVHMQAMAWDAWRGWTALT